MAEPRVFITQEEAEKYLLEVDTEMLDLLVQAANEFFEVYIKPDVAPNSIIKVGVLKTIKHWAETNSLLKAITDVDIHKEFNTQWADYSLPPEASALLVPFKNEAAPKDSDVFSFK